MTPQSEPERRWPEGQGCFRVCRGRLLGLLINIYARRKPGALSQDPGLPPADWLLPPPLLGPPRRRGPDGARRPSSALPWPVKVSSSEGIRRCQGVRDREDVKTPHLSPYWTCKDPEQRARYEFLLKLFRRTTLMRSRDGAGRGSAEISRE